MVNSISNSVTRVMNMAVTQQETTSEPFVKKNDMSPNQNEQVTMTDAQLKDKVIEMTEVMNRFISPMHTSLKFELHDELNEYYVSVVDDKTGDVIREIPPKKMLDMYAAMIDNMALFVDRKI